MLTFSATASQHLHRSIILLTFSDIASQHLYRLIVLLTFSDTASQHLHHSIILLTFSDTASQHLYPSIVLLTFSDTASNGLQNVILYCNYCYCKDAAELMNIRISGASEQNGDAARLFWSSRNVKKLKNCNAAKAAQFLYETCAPYHRYGQGFICLSGTRDSAYNGWIFRRKIHSLPRVVFNKKLCEPNGMQRPILRRELKNCNAAKAAQFLYEACAPYPRYGQGFKCSVCSSAIPYPLLTVMYTLLTKKKRPRGRSFVISICMLFGL